MAVTDLTDSLPWWVTGVQPKAGQPTPPGYGGGTSWLNYLASMFNPVGQAQAADDPQTAQLKAALAAQQGGGSQQQPPDVPIPAGSGAVGPPTTQPMGGGPARPAGVSASGLPLQPGALSPGALAQFASAAGGPIGSGGYVPWPSGGGSMNQTAPAPAGQTAPGAANPLASAGAGVTGAPASANPSRFVQVDRPNMPPTGGPMGRGGPPQMTALNLSGLFGRAPQANMGGNPANMPAPNAQPVAGVLSRRSKAPWGMGPFQQGSYGPRMPLGQ